MCHLLGFCVSISLYRPFFFSVSDVISVYFWQTVCTAYARLFYDMYAQTYVNVYFFYSTQFLLRFHQQNVQYLISWFWAIDWKFHIIQTIKFKSVKFKVRHYTRFFVFFSPVLSCCYFFSYFHLDFSCSISARRF